MSSDNPLPPADDPLLRAILEFVNAEDWDTSREVLGRNPLLLSDDADQMLGALIQRYQEAGDLRLAHHLDIHRDLLHRAREMGYRRAFEIVETPPDEALIDVIAQFIRAGDWDASRGVLEANPALLTPEADHTFQSLIQAAIEAGDEMRLKALTGHLELLRACNALGVDAAFAQATARPAIDDSDALMLLSVIGHNTMAVMLGDRDRRKDWLATLRQLQRAARADGDAALVALLSAVMRLINGEAPADIAVELGEAHRTVWQTIVDAVQAGPGTRG